MPDIRVLTSLTYGAHPRQVFDLFIPEHADRRAVVVCLHGGWWTQGSHHDLRPLALHLAELGFPAACAGFRQLAADGARGGAEMVDDIKQALRKTVEEAGLHGGAPTSAILLGSGSGSLLALTAAAQLGNEARPTVRVRAVIGCGVTPSLDPWEGCPLTLTRTLHTFANHQGHLLSPMAFKGDAFPPALFLHGDNDLDVPAKAVHKLHFRITEAGDDSVMAVIPGAGHQFIENPFDRIGHAALERIVPFLTEHAHEPLPTRGFVAVRE